MNYTILTAAVLALSIAIQAAAAIMAFRLIGITGRRLAWILISVALALMAVRRVVPLLHLIAGDLSLPPDLLNEVIGLVLSVTMATGIALIAPLFTEIKRAEDVIKHLAFYDPLTHLPNRHLLNDRLSQMIAASKRGGYYCALMFLDLDNFKPLNDTHGHGAGDLLLIEVANRLRSCVREIDTVARFGGDEFVVVLTELNSDKAKSRDEAMIVAEKIRISLSEIYFLKPEQGNSFKNCIEHTCSSSIGVTLFNGYEGSQEAIFKRADSAMYWAKEEGRNTVCFYNTGTSV
jgi:diguanylate cyclase (GGDEF)-like protein